MQKYAKNTSIHNGEFYYCVLKCNIHQKLQQCFWETMAAPATDYTSTGHLPQKR